LHVTACQTKADKQFDHLNVYNKLYNTNDVCHHTKLSTSLS